MPDIKMLIQKIKDNEYHINFDDRVIEKAYKIAEKAYAGNVRQGTGEPYINHPLGIIELLLEFFSKFEHPLQEQIKQNWTLIVSIILLHDALEDSDYTPSQIDKELDASPHLASKIIEGVSLLSKNYIYNSSEGIFEINPDFKAYKKIMPERLEIQYFLKIIQCNSKFWNHNHEIIFLIKCLDILHNTSTLEGVQKKKEMNIFKKTLNIWLPVIQEHFLPIYQKIILNIYTPERMEEAEKEGIIRIEKK